MGIADAIKVSRNNPNNKKSTDGNIEEINKFNLSISDRVKYEKELGNLITQRKNTAKEIDEVLKDFNSEKEFVKAYNDVPEEYKKYMAMNKAVWDNKFNNAILELQKAYDRAKSQENKYDERQKDVEGDRRDRYKAKERGYREEARELQKYISKIKNEKVIYDVNQIKNYADDVGDYERDRKLAKYKAKSQKPTYVKGDTYYSATIDGKTYKTSNKNWLESKYKESNDYKKAYKDAEFKWATEHGAIGSSIDGGYIWDKSNPKYRQFVEKEAMKQGAIGQNTDGTFMFPDYSKYVSKVEKPNELFTPMPKEQLQEYKIKNASNLKFDSKISKDEIKSFADAYQLDQSTTNKLLSKSDKIKFLEYDAGKGDIIYNMRTPYDDWYNEDRSNQGFFSKWGETVYNLAGTTGQLATLNTLPVMSDRIKVDPNAQYNAQTVDIYGVPVYNLGQDIIHRTSNVFDTGAIRSSAIEEEIKFNEKVEKYEKEIKKGNASTLSNIKDFPEYNKAFENVYGTDVTGFGVSDTVHSGLQTVGDMGYGIVQNPTGMARDFVKGFDHIVSQDIMKTGSEFVDTYKKNPSEFIGKTAGATAFGTAVLSSMGKTGQVASQFDLAEVPFEMVGAKIFNMGKRVKNKFSPSNDFYLETAKASPNYKVVNGKVELNYDNQLDIMRNKMFDEYLKTNKDSILKDMNKLNSNSDLNKLSREYPDIVQEFRKHIDSEQTKVKNINENIDKQYKKELKKLEAKKKTIAKYIDKNNVNVNELLGGKVHKKYLTKLFGNSEISLKSFNQILKEIYLKKDAEGINQLIKNNKVIGKTLTEIRESAQINRFDIKQKGAIQLNDEYQIATGNKLKGELFGRTMRLNNKRFNVNKDTQYTFDNKGNIRTEYENNIFAGDNVIGINKQLNRDGNTYIKSDYEMLPNGYTIKGIQDYMNLKQLAKAYEQYKALNRGMRADKRGSVMMHKPKKVDINTNYNQNENSYVNNYWNDINSNSLNSKVAYDIGNINYDMDFNTDIMNTRGYLQNVGTQQMFKTMNKQKQTQTRIPQTIDKNVNAQMNYNDNLNLNMNENVNANVNTNINANINANTNPNINPNLNINANFNANPNVNVETRQTRKKDTKEVWITEYNNKQIKGYLHPTEKEAIKSGILNMKTDNKLSNFNIRKMIVPKNTKVYKAKKLNMKKQTFKKFESKGKSNIMNMYFNK